jgi:hypothetical protein
MQPARLLTCFGCGGHFPDLDGPVHEYLESSPMLQIREYLASDWPNVWPILQETIVAGETYAFSPQSSEEEIRKAWIGVPARTFVASTRTDKFWARISSRPINRAWVLTYATVATW